MFHVYSNLPQDIKDALNFCEFIEFTRGEEEENHTSLREAHSNYQRGKMNENYSRPYRHRGDEAP